MAYTDVGASPKRYARISGWLYLSVVVVGIISISLSSHLIVAGDAAATARQIAGSQAPWRWSIVTWFMGGVIEVPLTVMLYVLLRPVNRTLSLAAALLNLIGVGVSSVDAVLSAVPLVLGSPDAYLNVFQTPQLQALSFLALRLDGYATALSYVFFGSYWLIFGPLVYSSGFLPKFIGVLLTITGVTYEIYGFGRFVAPSMISALPFSLISVGGISEIVLCLWLIAVGVREGTWREMASRT